MISRSERPRKSRRRGCADAAREKLESLGILAGAIGHDFNNILMRILGNASPALEQLPDDEPARYHIREIENPRCAQPT